MRAYELLFGAGGYGALVALLALSGSALALSMPWVRRVGEYFLFPWRPSLTPFFLVLAFVATLYAAQRASPVHWLPRRQRTHLLSLPLQIAAALFLAAPLVMMSTLLSPAHAWRPWIACVAILVGSLALSVDAFAVARLQLRRGGNIPQFVAALWFAHALLPLIAYVLPPSVRPLAAFSPIGASLAMLRGASRAEVGFAFLAPLLLGGVVGSAVLRAIQKDVHVPRA